MENITRRDIGMLLGAATLTAATTARAAGAAPTRHPPAPAGHDTCLQNCHDCELTCTQTVQHCLTKDVTTADAQHIRLMLNCASMCHLSASFMASDSEFRAKSCALCATVCEACAKACEATAGNDLMMQACAKACRTCAKTCREMAE
jgi:hypothetical protein